MNRRLWASVGLVVAVLGAGSAAAGSKERLVTILEAGKRAVDWANRTTRTAGWPVLAGVAVLAAGAVIATGRRRHRSGYAEPWRTVIQMAGRGRSASAIAQATGLPQDAVRILLAPVQVEISQRGNSFRSSQPADSPRRSDDPPRPHR